MRALVAVAKLQYFVRAIVLVRDPVQCRAEMAREVASIKACYLCANSVKLILACVK